MCELIFIFLYIMCALVEAVLMCINHQYYGDTQGAYYNIDDYQIIVCLFIFILTWIFGYLFYLRTRHKKGKPVEKKIYVKDKFTYVMTIWLIVYLIYTFKTKVGIVGSNAVSKLSPIFSMLDVTVVFNIYYILFRKREKKKIFILNVVLFCVLRIIQGFTGFILDIAMFELYFYCIRHKIKKNFIISCFVIMAMVFGGALFYRIMYPLKFAIRNDYGFEFTLILPYWDAVSKLISRFSTFSRGTFALFNMNKIKKLYLSQNIFLAEIKDIFKPVMPRFIMRNKDFASLCSCIFIAAFDTLEKAGGSSSPGILIYAAMVVFSDPLSAIIWLPLYIASFKFVSKIYALLEVNSTAELDILYFSLIIRYLMTGYLQPLLMITNIKLIFIGPFLYCIGMIRIKNNAKSYLRNCHKLFRDSS